MSPKLFRPNKEQKTMISGTVPNFINERVNVSKWPTQVTNYKKF